METENIISEIKTRGRPKKEVKPLVTKIDRRTLRRKPEEEKKETRKRINKLYYEEHKDKYKEHYLNYSHKYYKDNRDEVKRKNLARYHLKKDMKQQVKNEISKKNLKLLMEIPIN